MKRTLKITATLALFAVLVVAWLCLGIVKDPEFAEYAVCMKAHPTFKVYFYSPLGMSDKVLADLPPDLQAEERAYRWYVLGEM